MSINIKNFCLGVTCLLSLLATGCVETSMMFHGNSPSPAMNVVTLQKGGTYSGTWNTFDLTIDYTYSLNDRSFEVSGKAYLGDHYEMNYNAITKLFVYMFFLDENSKVLKTTKIVRAMTGSMDEIMTFTQQYTVPSGSTSITFGYDGTAHEMRNTHSFYELPLKRN